MPGLDLNEPINWDEIEEFEGGILDLGYNFFWDSGNEEVLLINDDDDTEDGDGDGDDQDDSDAADVGGEARADQAQEAEADVVDQADEAEVQGGTNAGNEAVAEAFDSGAPVNIKRRRYYPPDIKRILYAMCLERSAPGMLKEGVRKSVADDIGVPLRVVQRVWLDGQKGGGIQAFETNKKKNCGRKAMTSVTGDTIRKFLIEKVLPAIKEKWPAEERGLPIFIQHDNAKTHIAVDDPEFYRVAQEDGWDIRLMCQPPNSPDLNVLDLDFFAALQALFEKSSLSNIQEIESNVIKAYLEYQMDRSNRVFLTLQACMREIMREKGGYHYAIPHMKKGTLERIGALPVRLQVDKEIYQDALNFINA
ncbi:hypothetical protein C2845_PM09G20790 [Panicum miliaceum]|uniref:Uncharacterized protein n=1 Tax=Panicum miliaceum TaxID=4540 RepID=A0A3L6S2C7_PANMI|nr:hypothetical protein C2845_PM09G20790 [Panicum miliaceum]